jgi:hypothetical protein
MTDKQPPEWMGKNRKLRPMEIKEFLAEPVVARVATIDENGVPYVTPVWQEWAVPASGSGRIPTMKDHEV